ncbi:unannotated protein [freshwater metagenome]|uniref:Unannotated protein n=1 Tax=freshwater metagenome TaxID=449393 RepID=A0A6J6DM37_9ZZZZ
MLFGNTHIEHPLGIVCCHPVEPCGSEHSRGNAHYPRVLASDVNHLVAEDCRPGDRVGRFAVLSGNRINLAHRVELVGLIVESRLITATLLRNHVNDDRGFALLGLTERPLNILNVVTIDWAQVLDIEVGIQVLIVCKTGQETSRATAQAPIHGLTGRAKKTEESLCRGLKHSIRTLGADITQEPGHATYCRCVGASIVIDHNDEVAIVVMGDVVERLPRHTAGERTVTDDCHDKAISLAGHMEGPRDTLGPAQRARRVGALDYVVLRLRALRITGEASFVAKPGEVLPASQELVNIRLVSGIPDEGVFG